MKEFEVTYWFRDPQYGIQVSSEIFEAENEDEAYTAFMEWCDGEYEIELIEEIEEEAAV